MAIPVTFAASSMAKSLNASCCLTVLARVWQIWFRRTNSA